MKQTVWPLSEGCTHILRDFYLVESIFSVNVRHAGWVFATWGCFWHPFLCFRAIFGMTLGLLRIVGSLVCHFGHVGLHFLG